MPDELSFDQLVAELVESAAECTTLRIQRVGNTLFVSDTVVSLIGPEEELWAVFRGVPVRLPDGDGTWRCGWTINDEQEWTACKPIRALLEAKDKPTVSAKLTNAIVDVRSEQQCLARAIRTDTGYMFVNDYLSVLLKECPELQYKEMKPGFGGAIVGHRKGVQVMVLTFKQGAIDTGNLKPLTGS